MKKFVIIAIILDVLAVVALFFVYGPVSYFRELLVTSAMNTMNHKYLAKVFYDHETIYKILANNKIEETGDSTNTDDINFEEIVNIESKYDKEILDREEGAFYKIIDIVESNYRGYLVAIYDPSRISLAMTAHLGTSGQFTKTIARNNNALIAINASGFDDNSAVTGGSPTGHIIKDGKLIWSGTDTGWGGGLIGFNNNNVLVLTKDTPEVAIKNGMRDAVEFGPFLIVNGKSANVTGSGGYGLAPRTAIGQRKDGIVLFLVIDGRQPGYSIGADMKDLITIFKRYGAHNAANLDGGASTTLVKDNEFVNRQNYDRAAPNAWILK